MRFSKEVLSDIRLASELGNDKKLQEALEKALGEVNTGRHWQEEVGQWISVSTGYFHVRECYKELGAVSTKDMGAIRQAILYYEKKGIIEKWKARGNGWYRRKETDLIDLDWKNADETPLDIKLPLELNKMGSLYNGDIFIIAGEGQAGKSAMCLNIVELNMSDWECHYFSSELGKQKIKKRISFFDTPMELWDMPTHDRSDNYHDVLFSNAINLIDFLIVTDDFWKVGTQIKDIHLALRKTGGIAIVALQKSEFKKYGRGGDITKDFASLYITLSQSGKARIIKFKDWKTEICPDNEMCNYELINHSYFKQKTPWHYEEDEKAFTPRKW